MPQKSAYWNTKMHYVGGTRTKKNGALAIFSITALEKNPWAAIEVDCHAGKTRPVLAW